MKKSLVIASLALISMPAVVAAGTGGDTAGSVPEPSTLGLFVAAAIAITVLTKLKK